MLGLSFAYLILALAFATGSSRAIVIKKRNEIMEKSIQEKNVTKMTPKTIGCGGNPTSHYLLYLPNYGMTRLVACAALSFHEGADLILNSEKHIERKLDFVSQPKNPYVLLNETNVLTFKGDAEDADELLEEIKRLKNTSIPYNPSCLKKLIRPNWYFGKTALMIASEKKDAKMVEILLHRLPVELLDQTDSNGKSALFYACDDSTVDDQELIKEVVHLFLRLKYRQFDLFAKDNAGQTAFDYLPSELKTEFASQYPEFFSEV